MLILFCRVPNTDNLPSFEGRGICISKSQYLGSDHRSNKMIPLVIAMQHPDVGHDHVAPIVHIHLESLPTQRGTCASREPLSTISEPRRQAVSPCRPYGSVETTSTKHNGGGGGLVVQFRQLGHMCPEIQVLISPLT